MYTTYLSKEFAMTIIQHCLIEQGPSTRVLHVGADTPYVAPDSATTVVLHPPAPGRVLFAQTVLEREHVSRVAVYPSDPSE